jgi:hypothetical protein
MPPSTDKTKLAFSTGKMIAAVISSSAALVSVLSFMRSYGLVGDPGPAHLTVGDLGVTWVGLAPRVDTARAIGDTVYFAATITDRNGSVLVGASLVWSSDDPRVATVNRNGAVIARAPGTTKIVATVGDFIARSEITVQQRVASVRIAGDSAVAIAEGQREAIAVQALDARGNPIPGRTVSWRSDDTTVAYVDSAGNLAAMSPGRATLTATVDGISGQAPVLVAAVPGSLVLVAGVDQRAPAGATLGQPIIVKVLNRRGRPIGGIPVRFRSADGLGTFEPAVVFSEADGRARTTWTLGDVPGRQRLLASVDHVDSALTVIAEGDPVAKNTRVSLLADGQKAPVSGTLPELVGVRLTDSTGRPLADVPVSWSVLDGGAVTSVNARTDSLGESRAKWTLGARAGGQRLRVQIGTGRLVPPAMLPAFALAGQATKLEVVSGADQRGAVGTALAKRIVVRALDKGGNPVAGAAIRVAPSAGGVPDSTLAADSLGVVRIPWTLGRTAGAQRVSIGTDGVKEPVEVSATALPAAAANLEVSGPEAGVAGKALKEAVTITVTDAYGNPIAGASVALTASNGAVAPARAVTDDRGRVSTRWTLGTRIGAQTLNAAVRGTEVRGRHAVDATGPTATRKPAAASTTTKKASLPRKRS